MRVHLGFSVVSRAIYVVSIALHEFKLIPRIIVSALSLVVVSSATAYPIETVHLPRMPAVVILEEASSEQALVQPETILKGGRLRRNREANLGDTLSQELGVTSSSAGPGAGRPIIRGQDGPRIKVLEDGIGTGDLSIISPDHAVAAETLSATRIEMYRGPSTLLYGSGTSGGVVNVITDRIPDRIFKSMSGHFEGRFNSALEERSGAVNASGSLGQFSWNIEGVKRKTNDIKIPGRANKNDVMSPSGIVRNSAIDSSNLSVGGSYIGEHGFVGLSVSRLENFYGIPGPEGAKIDMGQTRYGLAGELDNPLSGFQQLKLKVNYNDYQHNELEGAGGIGSRLKNNEVEGRVELHHAPLANWLGVMGLQFQNQDFSAKGEEAFVPSSQSHSVGLFVLEQRNWERWQFEIGGRFEHTARNPQGNFLQSRDFGLYSVSAGSSWKFIDGYQIDLTATRGQRAPTSMALYANGIHVATNTFDQGNVILRKETSNNFDFALQKTTGAVRGRINLFYNHINDYIFQQSRDSNSDGLADHVNGDGLLDNNGAFLVQDFSQTRARFYGVEAEAMIALLPDMLDLRLFTDMVYAKLKNNGNIPRMTPQRFGLGLNYKWNAWRANVNLTRVTRQNRVAKLESETSGYTLMNAEAAYRFKRGKSTYHTLFLQGRNLLDSDIRVHTSFLKNTAPLPGRAIVVGIRGEF